MLHSRVLTGAVLVLTVGLILYFSYIPWVLNLAVAVLCALSIYELYRATYQLNKEWLVSVSMVGAVSLSFATLPYYHWVAAALLTCSVVLFLYFMSKIGQKKSFTRFQVLVIAALIVLMFQSIQQIRVCKYGLWELLLAILICALTDVAAYFVGKTCGKRKLAPKISPGKTVEGCIGGTVTAVLLLLFGCTVLKNITGIHVHYGKTMLYLVVASLLGQFGDLSMSAIKRIVGAKDFGTILPGHGGILDRFDSLLLVLPLTYLFCTCCGGFFG